jgi:hypothetical protein
MSLPLSTSDGDSRREQQLRADVQEELAVARIQRDRLERAGFALDEFGEYRAAGVAVILYPARCRAAGEWVSGYEVDLCLPNGTIGLDISASDLHLSVGPAPTPPGAPESP